MNITTSAPCGMACDECAIFLAAQDPDMAQSVAASWRARGFANARPEWFRCGGCTGDQKAGCQNAEDQQTPDRPARWNENCTIRDCCVDGRGLASCSDCPEFPCQVLFVWAHRGDHHARAYERLKIQRRRNL